LTAGRAYRAPNFSQQFIDTYVGTRGFDLNGDGVDDVVLPIRAVGNPLLAPETVSSYEVGLSNNVSERFRFDLTLFFNKGRNRFGADYTLMPTELVATPINEGRSVARGGELSVRWDPGRRARVLMNYTYQQVFDADTDEYLPNAPKHKGNLGFEFEHRRNWSSSWNLHVLDERRGEVDPTVHGFGVVDVRVARALARGTVALQAYNLFDHAYYETELYPMAGRTVLLELAVKF